MSYGTSGCSGLGCAPDAPLTPSWAALAGGARTDTAEAPCSAPDFSMSLEIATATLEEGTPGEELRKKELVCPRLQQRPSSLLGWRGSAFGLCDPVELEGAMEGG